MNTIWEGHIAGEFHGYKSGHVYELADGSRWRQGSSIDEPVYRERATAKLLRDGGTGHVFLGAEGTSGVVRVVPDARMFGGAWGAY